MASSSSGPELKHTKDKKVTNKGIGAAAAGVGVAALVW